MGLGDIAGDIGGGIVRGARQVVGVFDIGEPSGDDYGSSNWAAWGHQEIRSMLDDTVEPADIHEAAHLWREQSRHDVEIFANLTQDLNMIISNGWGGLSGEKAMGALRPVSDWSATFSEAAERTAQLMDHSGSSAGQAKVAVPPAMNHDMRRSLTSFAVGGFGSAFVDAIAQDQAQEEARREAVRIMTNVYSAPINDNRAAVPSYPQPVDPTLQTPEPSPIVGSVPGSGLLMGGSGIPGGGVPGGGAPYQPPAAAGLQGAGSVDGGQFGPPAASPQTGGQGYGGAGYPGYGGQGQGLGAAAAAAVPFMPPMAGGGDQERAHRGFRGGGPPAFRGGGVGGYPGGGGGDFGPRGSSLGPATAGEGRAGPGVGGAAGGRGAGGGVPGGVPVGGAGGRGQGGEDTEHQRPSYLIEMNDIFNDGRKVAPPVIGVDLPEDHR